jgi:hypothetical protein
MGPHAQLLFAGLWCIADKEGRLKDRPDSIKAQTLPFVDVNVDSLLSKLAEGIDPFIVRYEVNGLRFIQICNWQRHQSPHHTEKASEIPAFKRKTVKQRCKDGDKTEQKPSAPESVRGKRESGISTKTGGAGGTNGSRFVPPTVEEVAAYCRERGNAVDPQRFVDFYTGKGWRIGKNQMVDWRATVRTWEGRTQDVRAGPQTDDPRNLRSGLAFLQREAKQRGKS